MTESNVEWRFAEPSDRGAAQVFVCTDPERPRKGPDTGWQYVHPRMWEWDVQQIIRSLGGNHSFTMRGPVFIYVAVDDEGLAGVFSWTELDGPADVHLDVAGIAMRHRRLPDKTKRGVFARTLMKRAMSEIEGRAIESGAPELYVEGEIYRKNRASQLLNTDLGLRPFGPEHLSGAQTWNMRLPLADAARDIELS